MVAPSRGDHQCRGLADQRRVPGDTQHHRSLALGDVSASGRAHPGHHHHITGHRTPTCAATRASSAHHIIITSPSPKITHRTHALRLATTCEASHLANGLPFYTARPQPQLHELQHNGEHARSKENTAAAARPPRRQRRPTRDLPRHGTATHYYELESNCVE